MSDKRRDIPRPFSFDDMRHKRVEVMADGVLYQGILIGADDEDIFIKGSLRWIILPLVRVTSVCLAGQRPNFDDKKHISPSFYYPPDDIEEK